MSDDLTTRLEKFNSGKTMTNKELEVTYNELSDVIIILTGKGSFFKPTLSYLEGNLKDITSVILSRGDIYE